MNRVATILCALVLAACSSSESASDTSQQAASSTGAATTTASTSSVTATTEGAATTTPSSTVAETIVDSAPTSTVSIGSVDDLSPECEDKLGDYVEAINVAAGDVDLTTLTVGEFGELSQQIDASVQPLEAELEALGCDAYVSSDTDVELDVLTRIASERAPKLVPFFELTAAMSDPATSTALATCDEAVLAIEELMSRYPTLNDVTLAESSSATQALSALGSVCTPEQYTEIVARPDVSVFISG
jgi:hypothetical protein